MYKPVEEYSSFGGKITKLYYCAASAARELGISYYQMLKIIQSGKRYNHKYYRWYYKEPIKIEEKVYNIHQIKNGKVINQFNSINEASEVLGLGRKIITNLINTNQPDQWGCYWENLQKL